jgi:hypothetical protein
LNLDKGAITPLVEDGHECRAHEISHWPDRRNERRGLAIQTVDSRAQLGHLVLGLADRFQQCRAIRRIGDSDQGRGVTFERGEEFRRIG